MQVAVLGPLDVRTDDLVPVPVPGAGERLLLAVLVAGAPHVVSTGRLVDALWNGEPPPSPADALRGHIVRLRSCLEPGLPPNQSGRFVVGRGSGYALTLGREAIDAQRMKRLADRGHDRLAAGDAAEAARLFACALRLWRGDPYGEWPDAAFAREERRRLIALRADVEAGLEQARRALADRSSGGGPADLPASAPSQAPVRTVWAGPVPAEHGRPSEANRAPVDAAPRPAARADESDERPGRRPVRAPVIVGTVVAMLVVAGLAVRSQRLAEDAAAADGEAAVVAEAERLAARSTTGSLDLALLLAAQAVRLAETSETRERLAALLADHARVERIGRFPGFPEDAVLSGGPTLSLETDDEVVAWTIGPDTQPRGVLDVPRQWVWRSASPFPLEPAVMAAGLSDGVPWLRSVSVVDGRVRPVLEGDAIGGLPVDGALTPDGSRFRLLVAEPDAAPISSRWRVVEVDLATGIPRDTGIGGSFPAPPLALLADFAHDAGSFVLWGEGGGDTAFRVDLDGTQTPLQVSSRRSRSPALRVLPSGAAQLWADGVITVLDRSGAPIQELDAHPSQVYDIGVAADGTWAVSAGAGGVVVRWAVDPSTGRWSEQERLPGHVGGVVGAEVDHSSGRILVTVGEDSTAISWDMSPGVAPPLSGTDTSALLDRACSIVARDFTAAEWRRYLPDRPYAPTCTDLR